MAAAGKDINLSSREGMNASSPYGPCESLPRGRKSEVRGDICNQQGLQMTTEFVNQFSLTAIHPEFNASLSSLSLTNGRNELKAMTRHTAWQRGAPAMIGSVHVQGCAFCPKETDKDKSGLRWRKKFVARNKSKSENIFRSRRVLCILGPWRYMYSCGCYPKTK